MILWYWIHQIYDFLFHSGLSLSFSSENSLVWQTNRLKSAEYCETNSPAMSVSAVIYTHHIPSGSVPSLFRKGWDIRPVCFSQTSPLMSPSSVNTQQAGPLSQPARRHTSALKNEIAVFTAQGFDLSEALVRHTPASASAVSAGARVGMLLNKSYMSHSWTPTHTPVHSCDLSPISPTGLGNCGNPVKPGNSSDSSGMNKE